jgi:hypothetical protein
MCFIVWLQEMARTILTSKAVHRPSRAAAEDAKRKIHQTYVGSPDDYDTSSESEPETYAHLQRHASGRLHAARHKRKKTTLLPHAAAANHGEPLNLDLQRKKAALAHQVGGLATPAIRMAAILFAVLGSNILAPTFWHG